MKRFYTVMMNRTAGDVVTNNDEKYTNYTKLAEAQEAAHALQKAGIAVAAWVVEVRVPKGTRPGINSPLGEAHDILTAASSQLSREIREVPTAVKCFSTGPDIADLIRASITLAHAAKYIRSQI